MFNGLMSIPIFRAGEMGLMERGVVGGKWKTGRRANGKTYRPLVLKFQLSDLDMVSEYGLKKHNSSRICVADPRK